MSWFKNILPRISTSTKKGVPEGVWSKCPSCLSILYRQDLERNLEVCPKCTHHLRIGGRRRLACFLDPGSGEELAQEVKAHDCLKFRDTKKYKDRLSAAEKKTGEKEALIVMKGTVKGIPMIACAFDFYFVGGTMSAAVGERFVIAVAAAIADQVPLVCFSASGGARMQEGLVSLFQMAKTSAALARLQSKRLPFISVLCDPTMGGVSASLATLADIIIAEPKALIGFSGPRVIQQTIKEVLPENFQRSEFLKQHGAIDAIVSRAQMRPFIARIVSKLMDRPAIVDDNERATEA